MILDSNCPKAWTNFPPAFLLPDLAPFVLRPVLWGSDLPVIGAARFLLTVVTLSRSCAAVYGVSFPNAASAWPTKTLTSRMADAAIPTPFVNAQVMPPRIAQERGKNVHSAQLRGSRIDSPNLYSAFSSAVSLSAGFGLIPQDFCRQYTVAICKIITILAAQEI